MYKLAIWASAAGMVVLVMAINWQRGGSSVEFGARNVVLAIILAGFWIYFLRKSQVHLVADGFQQFLAPPGQNRPYRAGRAR